MAGKLCSDKPLPPLKNSGLLFGACFDNRTSETTKVQGDFHDKQSS